MKTSSDLPTTPLERLAAVLAGMGLIGLQVLEEIAKEAHGGATQFFVVRPHLRLAEYFDLESDLLIYDRGMGTVGLVYQLVEEEKELAHEVESRLDQAAYVRHLLLTDPGLKKRLPLTVELAFLVHSERLQLVGTALRRVALQSPSFLEAVGVSFLAEPQGGDSFSPADLRRAFPWLLQAARGWYTIQKPGELALAAVELLDYRLPGQRTLDLQASKVHLVFGQNGSGKSSLVEALELAVTGKAERLANVDYTGVIRSRRAGGSNPARVIFRYCNEKSAQFEIGPKGITEPINPGLPATGFRLDQTVMDRLTRGGDTLRAEVFLQSFFPTEHADLLEYQRCRAEAEAARGRLPEAMGEQLIAGLRPDEDPEEGMLRQLEWLNEGQNPLPPEMAAACLPLSLAHLKALGGRSSNLAQLAADWSQVPPIVSKAPDILSSFDEALEGLRGSLSGLVDALSGAREALRRVEDWQATGSGGTGRDFLADLNGWLQRSALADLAAQHCQLLEALSAARRLGWVPEPNTIGPFAQLPIDAAELDALRKQADDWASERDEFFQRVMTVTAAAAGEGKRSAAEITRLSPLQKERLNTVGRWLQLGAAELSLGQAIEKALETDSPVQFGEVVVGTGEWAQTLRDRLTFLEEAVRALQELKSVAGARVFQALKDTRSSYRDLQDAGTKVKQNFLWQLQGKPGDQGGRLVDALNELMALFTPARWAYEDIDLRYRDGAGARQELGFQIGQDVQAALSLNTAQLNLFTVALFLLCAVRAENKLGLMVLDDPLQNMDELTVTTLARGIAKVSRLWGKSWSLVLFFHGQEDRDRFRREVPLASYQLPWLSPGEGPEDPITIRAEESLYDDDDLQCLTEVARTLA